MEHVLFDCEAAKRIWKLSPVSWGGLADLQANFWRWWEGLLQAKERERGSDRIELTINILWQIWKARNKACFNRSIQGETVAVQKAQ